MGLADIKLKLRPGGHPDAVIVNGQNLSNNVSAVRVQANPREVPQVHLQVFGEIDLEGEGIVHLEPQAIEVDVEEILGTFLANIDPEELEVRALGGAGGLGDDSTTGQHFLRALKEMAGLGD